MYDNNDEEVIKQFKILITTEEKEGEAYLLGKVVDKYINYIYQKWIKKDSKYLLKQQHIGLQIYNYFLKKTSQNIR